MSKRYNYCPDRHDHRDWVYKLAPDQPLPAHADLTPLCSPVFDQGDIGSCTGNALAGAFEFLQLMELRAHADPKLSPEEFVTNAYSPASRLFIYWYERFLEGTVGQDSGAQIRDGIKVLRQYGVCRESLWRYTDSNVVPQPALAAQTEARLHRITSYARLTDLASIKHCLASGYPVVIGFTVPESFESSAVAASGVLAMPLPGEQIVGGHAVMVVGYDDKTQRLIVRNSWGKSWGQGGYFTMPYGYINPRWSSDYWTLRR